MEKDKKATEAELRELGLNPDFEPNFDLANKIFVAYLLRQHERREALHAILDSHIKQCERVENSGKKVQWDWTIEVTERVDTKNEQRISMKLNQQSSNITGTNFSSSSTSHNANPDGDAPRLMSKEGAALASVAAPSSAFVVSNKSTGAVKES